MICFDTETTGLLKPEPCELHLQPEIIEFYACKFDWDGKIIAEIETYIKPLLPIGQHITEITGIENRHVTNAPRFAEVFDDIADFFRGEKVAFAHNAGFDFGVLSCELRRMDMDYKFPWPTNQICTVEASYPINNKRMKLGDLYQLATGKLIKNAHRAKGDVMATVQCVLWLKKNGFINENNC